MDITFKVMDIKIPKLPEGFVWEGFQKYSGSLLHNRRNIMDKVKVRRIDLLKVVKENRGAHEKEYKESVADYKTIALAEVKNAMGLMERQISALKEGELVKLGMVHFTVPYPESHVKDYDRAIKMLEMSVDEIIEIEDRLFAQYVMDDWDWKEKFRATKSFYETTAGALR